MPATSVRDLSNILGLVNPDTNTISCVGDAPSKHRRCRVRISKHSLAAAERVLEKLVQPDLSDEVVKSLLVTLAEYTLCRQGRHNGRGEDGQVDQVANRWFAATPKYEEDDLAQSDAEDAGTTWEAEDAGNASEDVNPGEGYEDDTEICELRRQLAALLARKRGMRAGPEPTFEAAQAWQEAMPFVDRARDADCLRDERVRTAAARRAVASRRAEQARSAEAARLATEARLAEETRLAEEVRLAEAARLAAAAEAAAEQRRRETQRQAELERERREAEARTRAERNRVAKEKAEQYRRDRERKEQEARDREVRVWNEAWTRYTEAFDKIQYAESQLSVEELEKMLVWPTRIGTMESCTAGAVREFFENMPDALFKENRSAFAKAMRWQAAQWHPDKTCRTFANLQEDARAVALVVSQVANELLRA